MLAVSLSLPANRHGESQGTTARAFAIPRKHGSASARSNRFFFHLGLESIIVKFFASTATATICFPASTRIGLGDGIVSALLLGQYPSLKKLAEELKCPG